MPDDLVAPIRDPLCAVARNGGAGRCEIVVSGDSPAVGPRGGMAQPWTKDDQPAAASKHVADDDAAGPAGCHADRTGDLSGALDRAPRAQVPAQPVEHLDAVPAGDRHVETTRGSRGQTACI